MIKNLLCILFLVVIILFGSGSKSLSDNIHHDKQKSDLQKSRLSKLLELSKNQVETGDQGSIVTAESALKLADSLHLENEKATALSILGIAWKIKGDNKTSVSFSYEALRIFEKLGNASGCAECYLNIGEAHRAGGNYEKSWSYLKSSLKLFEKCYDTAGLAKVYNRFAATGFEDFFCHDTLENNKLFPISNPTVSNFNKVYASDSSFRRKFDAINRYINLSDNFANKQQLTNLKISNRIILGALYTLCNLFDKALQIDQANFLEIKKTGNQMDEALALYNLGILKFRKKDYNGALESGKESLRLSYLLGVKNYVMLSTGLISSVLEKMGNYKEANQYVRESYQKRIEMARSDIEMKLQTMKQEFDMTDKQNEINSRNRLLKVAFISFIVIICIIGVFVMILFRKNKEQKLLNEELKKKNEIIIQQNEKLGQLNREKDQLFSILAHDLRSPFNIFLGYTELLVKELPTLSIDVIKGFAENMRKSAISLYRLLENLLQWSRMQQGLMPFNPESVLLSELMDESLSAVQESAGQKRIQIKSSIAADLKVVADRNMIQTVIRNLVFNAVKFTHSDGLISISASISSDNKVEISIHDTGIGMNEQILENLFQANRNSIRTGTLGETSTGLGLILCKEFVEKHGGTLWAKSEVGKGSSFIFSLTSSC